MKHYIAKFMQRDDILKFAIVGCGHIGKRHAAMINSIPGCELVALADTGGREKLGIDAYPVPFFSSLDAMLEAGPSIDVLCVATPNGLHEEHALKGLKTRHHVVIEKPMALSKAGCEMMIQEALQQHRKIFCVMQNRYSPPSVWLKELIQQGILGKIFMVQVNCYWNRDERYYRQGNWHGTKELDGGVLFTQFSHFIDILYWLFGDIEDISARFNNFSHQHLTGFDDTGLVNFNFRNGGMGCINFSTSVWDQNLESSITIIAEHGTVKIGGQYMNKLEYCHIKDYVPPVLSDTEPPVNYGGYTGSAANHWYFFKHVASVLKGNAPIHAIAEEGLKTVEIIERIYRSAVRELV